MLLAVSGSMLHDQADSPIRRKVVAFFSPIRIQRSIGFGECVWQPLCCALAPIPYGASALSPSAEDLLTNLSGGDLLTNFFPHHFSEIPRFTSLLRSGHLFMQIKSFSCLGWSLALREFWIKVPAIKMGNLLVCRVFFAIFYYFFWHCESNLKKRAQNKSS